MVLLQLFLQLWAEFDTDPVLRNWAAKTPLLPSLLQSDDSAPRETIFNKLVSMYHDTVTRSQDMIVQLVCTEVESGIRAYHAATSDQ